MGQRGAKEDTKGFALNWRKGTAIYQHGEARRHTGLGDGNHEFSLKMLPWKCLLDMRVWTLEISIWKSSSDSHWTAII